MPAVDDPGKFAIIDANINRITEGLRVVEDWARFYLRDEEMTMRLRKARHELWQTVTENYSHIVTNRDTRTDILSDKPESTRKETEDIPRASFNRVKEGLRVLEEMGKLISSEASFSFKKLRFAVYDMEKDFYERNNKQNS